MPSGSPSFLSLPAPPALLRAGNLFSWKVTSIPIGSVNFLNVDMGYGFIAPEVGCIVSFVHISAVERAGMGMLQKDQRLSYEVETDQRGKLSAVNLASV